MKPEISEIITELNLKPHWSSDYLSEFYRSEFTMPKSIIGQEFDSERPLFNWAYYLLPEGCICPFHMHIADESWQYCLGGPLDLFLICEEGHFEKVRIGNDILNGEKMIHIVPKSVWMAAKTAPGTDYALITHMVSPGFFPQDNTKGYLNILMEKFPQHISFIKELAWPDDLGCNVWR